MERAREQSKRIWATPSDGMHRIYSAIRSATLAWEKIEAWQEWTSLRY